MASEGSVVGIRVAAAARGHHSVESTRLRVRGVASVAPRERCCVRV